MPLVLSSLLMVIYLFHSLTGSDSNVNLFAHHEIANVPSDINDEEFNKRVQVIHAQVLVF